MNILIYGLITGILFGYLLQKGKVLRYDTQLGALRLIDMTVMKFMLSAIIVGMVGVYILKDAGIIKLNIKSAILGSNVIGGLIFGFGWALLGYCPGTSYGALGEGRIDGIFGIIGMITGGAIYAEVYPFMKKTVLTWGKIEKKTLPEIFGISHWIIIPVLIILTFILFKWIEKRKL
jgi:uncharacterized membrane protein YedE/YeeE